MNKLYILAIAATLTSGFVLANTYDSSSSSSSIDERDNYPGNETGASATESMDQRENDMDERQSMEETTEDEMDDMSSDEKILRSSTVGGASAPRYDSDENRSFQ